MATVATVSAGSPYQENPLKPILFAATYTRDEGWINGTGKGIYTYQFDTTTGSLTPWAVTPVGINPIFVLSTTKVFSTGQRVIYAINAVNENSAKLPGTQTGYVSALTLQHDGTLKLLNTLETLGGSPTHISLSPKQDHIIVSCYGGSLTMFPLKHDGSLGDANFHQAFKQSDEIKSIIHSATWLVNSNHVVVANLGTDELLQYNFDVENQDLKPLKPVKVAAGSGPRHMVVNPNGKVAYVVNEVANTIDVLSVDKASKLLKSPSIQTITTLPADFKAPSTSAEIVLSKNGKFIYSSNRGQDSIAIFKVNENDGTLTLVGFESSRGKGPRGFTIYGDWLIVTNQNSDDMYVFKVDSTTGLLQCTGKSYKINTAVCLHVAEF
ncbi:hypothetical protein CCR75_004576 [Bremia lactucae]|uniref:6-phosphogluconolactonase n=1 Tax=Bremia lactucae TaxID=4779 RepID=A0A976FL46_BRELC|nr:hypothetical protein CCR75_004576 [Bremia lactucae]